MSYFWGSFVGPCWKHRRNSWWQGPRTWIRCNIFPRTGSTAERTAWWSNTWETATTEWCLSKHHQHNRDPCWATFYLITFQASSNKRKSRWRVTYPITFGYSHTRRSRQHNTPISYLISWFSTWFAYMGKNSLLGQPRGDPREVSYKLSFHLR